MRFFIFILMMIGHITDDYYLQGILAKLKQKKWWEENAPETMYQDDYKMALFMHSFSWAFSIMLPLWIYMIINNQNLSPSYIFFIINIFAHAYVDDMKANKLKINLIEDQLFHMVQIVYTWCFLI